MIKKHPSLPIFVSDNGEVKDLKGNLKIVRYDHGYQSVQVKSNGKNKICRIHKLVLETFVEARPKGLECRHLDGNPLNNKLENLKWDTHSNNVKDTHIHKKDHWKKAHETVEYFI